MITDWKAQELVDSTVMIAVFDFESVVVWDCHSNEICLPCCFDQVA